MKEGDLTECPPVLCENVKEAEHLAATLALYRLCKGQVSKYFTWSTGGPDPVETCPHIHWK